tara:strand:+ start:347 stop:535 length:189 start_codon:yes stop_codon:yes gene_type:complete
MFKILMVNDRRYLINVGVSDTLQDNQCRDILKYAPHDAIIEFSDPLESDFRPHLKYNWNDKY